MTISPTSKGASSHKLSAPLSPFEPKVHRHTVGEVLHQVRDYRLSRELRRMAEALQGWRAHYETFLALCAETRQEGWPFQIYPPGWSERAAVAVALLKSALAKDFDCHYPERGSSNLRHLALCVETAIHDPSKLTGRQVGLARQILLDSEARWGALGSAERSVALSNREEGEPHLEEVRSALLQRLSSLDPDGAVDDLAPLLEPVAGQPVPEPLALRVRRAWKAPVADLVRAGVIESMYGLASVSSQWTSQVLQRTESSLDPLKEMVRLTWSQFPEADLPAAMAADWNLLLDRSTAIFRLPLGGRGEIDAEHARLARLTLRTARGTLYDRYYSLPELDEWTDSEPEALWEIGRRRARSRDPERASLEPPVGQIFEEVTILTSAGLWPLRSLLWPDIDPASCASRTLAALLAELRLPCSRKYQRWQRHRRSAYLWQRALFFLSLMVESDALELAGAFRLDVARLAQTNASAALGRLLDGLSAAPAPEDVLTGWSGGQGLLSVL